MIRALMLISSLDVPGGAERTAVALATHMPRDRFEVTVCAHRSTGGVLADQLDAAGIAHFCLDRRSKLDLLPFRRLARFLRSERIDVLHSHIFNTNVWGAVIGTASGVPAVVAHEHGSSYDSTLGAATRVTDRHVVGRLSDAFVVGTEAERERVTKVGKVPGNKVEVIPAPYIPRPSSSVSNLRLELDLPETVPLVGTAAILRPEKRLDVLLEAFALVAARIPDVHLAIAGDGPDRPELELQAQNLGLAERVRFLGMRENIEAVLQAIDVGVISSDRESTPLFAFECMASMTPLVSTRVGSPAEFLADGESVVLTPPGDASGLAEAITSLLTSPDRRLAIAEAARRRLEPYSLDQIVPRYAGLYERLLPQTRSHRST